MPPPNKFVPRQRKRKVLDRERALEKRQQGSLGTAEKARLQHEWGPGAIPKASGKKKKKRLEHYLKTKLEKDENKRLLARLRATKIDTSLLASSKTLGHTKETKKQAIARTLREEKAGLGPDEERTALLTYAHRSDAHTPTQKEGTTAPSQQPQPTTATLLAATQAASSLGSGLKRALRVDEDGRPVLAKRQKRGGVQTKFSIYAPESRSGDEGFEEKWEGWGGFSDDDDDDDDEDDHEKPDGTTNQQIRNGNQSRDNSSDDDERSPGHTSEDEDASAEESGSDDSEARGKRPSSLATWLQGSFKKAQASALAGSNSTTLQIPTPANFAPRPVEEDPLPAELQQTTNSARKAYVVAVERDPEIQEARLKLPVVYEEHKIMDAIYNNDVVVICGATGSGKTTQIPQFLFEAGYGSPGSPNPGMVAITQPRRVAAVNMAKRVGQELGNHSDVVAYQIRYESSVMPNTTRIKFMTDGVLLREASSDLALRKYSAIIVDEAQERSANTDILIALLSRVTKVRAETVGKDPSAKPLKFIIMSATLRVEDFTQNPRLFPAPPRVVEVEGRQHDISIHFSRRTHPDCVEEAFRNVSRSHKKLPPGGILVFLTSKSDIFELSRRLKAVFGGSSYEPWQDATISGRDAPLELEDIEYGEMDYWSMRQDDFDQKDGDEEVRENDQFEIEGEEELAGSGPRRMHILPLHSKLPIKEQMKVFCPPPDGTRLVVLATNVAETSLTIPGIRYVFDCGRCKERRVDPFTDVQRFEIEWISKASAEQRAGRAGRTGPGHCWRLYSSAMYERFAAFTDPDLLKMPMDGVVLKLKAMGLPNVVKFPFPTPPDEQSLVRAEKVLTYLGAIEPGGGGHGRGGLGGKVTVQGTTMEAFPVVPRHAKILLAGNADGCLPYTIALVTGLSVPEIFIPEQEAMGTAERDTRHDDAAQNLRDVTLQMYRKVQRDFSILDDRSDAIKLLEVVRRFAHEPTEKWCKNHFVRFRALREVVKMQSQLVKLIRTTISGQEGLHVPKTLGRPSEQQLSLLKQIAALGFIDQVAIRADKAPNPPAMGRRPSRAMDVPYLPLVPVMPGTDSNAGKEANFVYIHSSSVLARLSVHECPKYVIYAYLQQPRNVDTESGDDADRRVTARERRECKTRMHPLTDISEEQLAALTRGSPLVSYGKPIKEVSVRTNGTAGAGACGTERDVLVVPYLRAEGTPGMGWPLPARIVTQRREWGKGWVVLK